MNSAMFCQSTCFNHTIVTAGSNYLDIDAYACMAGMAELLRLQNVDAIACSTAVHNYSICPSLVKIGQILQEPPSREWETSSQYIIVDVSDPEYLKDNVPLENVVAVYDHHAGFESYWENRIGKNAKIEFIGAAATLIYREWKLANLQHKMSCATAQLLIAAILDNTLNLTSANTTAEDVEAFNELCLHANVDSNWCADYFSQVQACVEQDLRNALLNDTKTVRDNPVLPPNVAQICVWDSCSILRRIPEIRQWFHSCQGNWMINVIDLQQSCSWFVCDDPHYQEKIGSLFGVAFENGAARTPSSFLRKEIIKQTLINNIGG